MVVMSLDDIILSHFHLLPPFISCVSLIYTYLYVYFWSFYSTIYFSVYIYISIDTRGKLLIEGIQI